MTSPADGAGRALSSSHDADRRFARGRLACGSRSPARHGPGPRLPGSRVVRRGARTTALRPGSADAPPEQRGTAPPAATYAPSATHGTQGTRVAAPRPLAGGRVARWVTGRGPLPPYRVWRPKSRRAWRAFRARVAHPGGSPSSTSRMRVAISATSVAAAMASKCVEHWMIDGAFTPSTSTVHPQS